MANLPLHEQTSASIANFKQSPSHALIISGPPGSGKLDIAISLGEQLLTITPNTIDGFAYAKIIQPLDNKAIGIDHVRELEHFLSLKVPSPKAINRVVIIADSHTLTTEAQNALLKTIEEPPRGSLIILTAAHEQSLLPTIRSRAQHISVKLPELSTLEDYFASQGHNTADIKRALSMSGSLPGLAQAILKDSQHPLLPATEKAREILRQSKFERLATIDSLTQDRELCRNTLFILQQMAHLSLNSATGLAAKRWQTILSAVFDAQSALATGAQPKLALSNLFLQI